MYTTNLKVAFNLTKQRHIKTGLTSNKVGLNK